MTLEPAVSDYRIKAERGDPEAQYQLGKIYAEGTLVNQDLGMAALWYKRAAERNHPAAQFEYALMFWDGRGVSQDSQKALDWFLRAAESGNAAAQYQLACCYCYELSVSQDYEEALKWCRLAAASGHSDAENLLGSMFHDGWGVKADSEEACRWYRLAADKGNILAKYNLGSAFEFGDGAAEDLLEATYWYRQAAEDGDAEAQLKLGVMLAQGRGVAANRKEAMSWLTKAAEQGNASAQVELSELYVYADDPDYDLAHTWARKAAQQENARAQFLLGWILENVEEQRDLEQAILWYRRAADKEDVDAQARLLELSLDGSNGQLDSRELAAASPSPQPSAPEAPLETPTARQAGFQFRNFGELPPGSILSEKYLIEGLVGKGGMAMVFRARHLLMDRTVAIKMLLPEIAADEQAAKRFQREAKAASILTHPNIITVFDFGVTADNQPFIVMDFLEGQSLDDLLEQEGRLPLPRSLRIFEQTADALSAAHDEGIVHRDIKPSNIMLVSTKQNKEVVKIVDFGIAKIINETESKSQKLTKTGEVFGSLAYMSPEQCLGKPLDARSDIYALGCVIFETLTGQPAFMGDTIFETMSKHIYQQPPSLSDLLGDQPQALELDQIFQMAVAKEPDQRFQSMQELKEILSRLSR